MIIDPAVLPGFLGAVAVILVAPGPDMAFMVAAGLEGGTGAAVRAALGITAGVSVYVVLSAVGVGALLQASPGALVAVRLGGAAYLLHLGVRAWRAAGDHAVYALPGRMASFFRRGFVVNITNPKIAVFFAAFLPQFVVAERGAVVTQLVVLGLILQSLGLALDLVVGVLAGTVRDRVLVRPRLHARLTRAAAGVYLVVAGVLVAESAWG